MHVKYDCCISEGFKPYLKFINNKVKYMTFFAAVICIFT